MNQEKPFGLEPVGTDVIVHLAGKIVGYGEIAGKFFYSIEAAEAIYDIFPEQVTVMKAMSEELLPCPFCGGEAEFERVGNRRQSTIVSCTECGCHLESGDEWLARNGAILESCPIPVQVARWGRWLAHPDYAEVRGQFQELYEGNARFQNAVETDVALFASRRAIVSPAHKQLIVGNSREFILEEVSGHTLLNREFPSSKVYPGRSLESLRLIRDQEIPNAPKGLEKEYYVRVNFEHAALITASPRASRIAQP